MMLRRFIFGSLFLVLALGPLSPQWLLAGESGKTGDSADEAGSPSKEDGEYYELLRLFADTLDQIERNYVKPVDRRELMESAIRGLMSELDPYSNYISPEDLGRFRDNIDSQFGGIGIQVTIDNARLKIISPLVGTPAYRAGIMADDVITKIEGESTDGIRLDEAVQRMKGDIGTDVTITVMSAYSLAERTVTIRRELIRVDTVRGDVRNGEDNWEFMHDDEQKIGYLRVSAFSRNTARELRGALDDLQRRQMQGLVLDLRFNPGGLLSSAVEVSDLFIAKGLIVSTEGRNTERREWSARSQGSYQGFPMAVIVNRFSASASEIVAACLQDHDRAIIIGERTWGKGSVQNVIDLEDGKSALKLTTAGYQRPNGKNIHRFHGASAEDEWGVLPSDGYLVALEPSEVNDYLRYRRDRDIVRSTQEQDGDESGEEASGGDSQSEDGAAGEEGDPSSQLDKSEETGAPEESGAPEETGVPEETDAPDESGTPEETGVPEETGTPGEPSQAGGERENATEFVDRQLQKALEYVREKLASAEIAQEE